MDDYEVFLNHGPDVKGGFIAHLYEALRAAGLNPFLDKKSLVKGGPASTSMDAALQVARVHVAVVSKGYAESKHCLSELVVMLKGNKPVIPVFFDVEPWELRRVEMGKFAAAFKKHRSREAAENVKEWADALGKLADITGFCFRLSDYQADEVELKQEVVDAILYLLPSHGALQVECHLVGLEKHMKTCINELEKTFSATTLLGLVGMGGIGKTSLAKAIYNHFISHSKFQAMSILEIGKNSTTSLGVGSNLMKRLQKQLLWDLLRIPKSNQLQSYIYWYSKLSRLGAVLIVLDDIKDKDQFDKLICSTSLLASGSCIIVTSRDRHLLKLIARKCDFVLYEVPPLGCEDSIKLFNWHAFDDEEAPNNFIAFAKDVSKACGGLPLALKVIGSSLFGKMSNEDLKCIWPEAIKALRGDPDVRSVLKWSYNHLSDAEKLMFVDIAYVFCGWSKQEAIEIWQSCKRLSLCCGNGAPHTTLGHLIDKSLVVLDKFLGIDVLTMHGLLQDMGQDIGEVEGGHLWKGKAIKVIEDNSEKSNKVRTMNLANSEGDIFHAHDFAMMSNLHFLQLDGCTVRGNFGSISKELQYSQWRDMPLIHVPPILNLSYLISVDFSDSSKLANLWIESKVTLEGCPSLRTLNLSKCTSITMLPDSIGCLSSLQVLNLNWCKNLQKLPFSIGQLSSLELFYLGACRSLEALPDSITALSRLRGLSLEECSSLSILQAPFGLMTSLMGLNINLATKGQVVGIKQLNTLKELGITRCTDDVITMLDNLNIFTNLDKLSQLLIDKCPSITKFPETIQLLTNLNSLDLWRCEKVREVPNSIGQLKVLRRFHLRHCNNLETLPNSLGTLSSLQDLSIVNCTAIIELPISIGHLLSLKYLHIEGCSALQSLPDSLAQLNGLQRLEILDCGSNMEGLDLREALQSLPIWGCSSITTKLSRSCLVVLDNNLSSPAWILDGKEFYWVGQDVKEVQTMEAKDCRVLHHVQDLENGRAIL